MIVLGFEDNLKNGSLFEDPGKSVFRVYLEW